MTTHTKIDKGKAEREHIMRVLSRPGAVFPNTSENLSRDRLLRVRAGVQHLLSDVLPRLESSPVRNEVFQWLDEMLSLLNAEECCASLEAIKQGGSQ